MGTTHQPGDLVIVKTWGAGTQVARLIKYLPARHLWRDEEPSTRTGSWQARLWRVSSGTWRKTIEVIDERPVRYGILGTLQDHGNARQLKSLRDAGEATRFQGETR